MKKILLIGDSIRLGYDKYVKKAFEDCAEVYYPQENCRFAAYVLRNLHEWKAETGCDDDVDLVHWNAGLWDDLILFDEEALTPIEVYKDYIDRICKRIKLLFPKAKMVFATSTAILENLYPENMTRYNKDTESYNKAACEIVKKYGAEIDDLYEITKNAPREYYSDMTHLYTKNGTEMMTTKVVECIEGCLDIKGKALDYGLYFKDEENIVGL